MSGYAKLWSSIVHSTVWQEPLPTKVVWVTMLALSDMRGYVGASVPGLAHAAGVTVPECEAALERFLAPDPYSRTKEHEGRRIVVEDGGWRLLTYEKHREAKAEEDRRIQNREAQKRWRENRKKRKQDSNAPNAYRNGNNQTSAQAEASTEAATATEAVSAEAEAELHRVGGKLPEVCRDSLRALTSASRAPLAFVGEVGAMLDGMRGKGTDAAVMSCALIDMAVAGVEPTARALRGFVRKAGQPDAGTGTREDRNMAVLRKYAQDHGITETAPNGSANGV
jgi:hypothetical protein